MIGLSPAGAAAQTSPPARTVSASAAEVFALAEVAKAKGASRQALHLLEVLSHDPNPQVRGEARFRRALLFEAAGRARDAAVELRRILDDDPDVAAVRLKLASILHALGEDEQAFRELRALRSSDVPLQVARIADRMSAVLQANKPWGLQLEFAIAPDSNINRATSSETVGTVFGDFQIDEKPKSGTGVALRAIGHSRRRIGDSVTMNVRLNGEAALYGRSRFNDISLGISAGPELLLGRTRIGADVGIAQQWFGMERYQRTTRISGSVVLPVDAVSQIRLEPAWRRTDDRINDLRDGHGLAARMRYERALSPQFVVAASITGDRYRAADDAFSTRSFLVGLSLTRDVGRMTLNLAADAGRLKADDRLSILSRAREDRLLRISLGAVLRQLTVAGFAPLVRVTAERNRSTVEFYDFKRTRTEFGIARAF